MNEELKPSFIVNHKGQSLLIIERTKEGKYLCCKLDEPVASQKSNGKLYKAEDISQYVKFQLKIFNEKDIPLSILQVKLKLTDPITCLESLAKSAFEKLGPLILDGKTLSNKSTVMEENITDGSMVTSVMGGSIKYKEKRDVEI